jgi:hypothetical protein
MIPLTDSDAIKGKGFTSHVGKTSAQCEWEGFIELTAQTKLFHLDD